NYVSLPGYIEILSGRPTMCTDNKCARVQVPTFLDEARAARASVAAFSAWESIANAATSNPGGFFVSAGRHDNEAIDPWPGEGQYRPDHFTADAARAYSARVRPDVFFLGLGDTDERAHHGDYPGYVDALRRADDTLGRLVELTDNTTTSVVTADHGRAVTFNHHGAMPEAARVWMVASGPRIFARGEVTSP